MKKEAMLRPSKVQRLILAAEATAPDRGPLWTGAESRRQAEARGLRYSSILDGVESREAQALSGSLYWCALGLPCGSAACPTCSGATQRWLVRQAKSRFGRLPAGKNAIAITAVAREGLVPAGTLHQLQLEGTTALYRRKFIRSGIAQAIGGIDFNLNHGPGRGSPVWSAHAHVFTTPLPWTPLRRRLAISFPPSVAVQRPIRGRPFDRSEYGFSYALKTIFFRSSRFSRADGRLHVAQQHLRQKELIELLLFLGPYEPLDRCMLVGARAVSVSSGEPRIEWCDPP